MLRQKCKLTHLDVLNIPLDEHGNVSVGCNQQWYGKKIQQWSGCGPTVATTMMMYINRQSFSSKQMALQQMNDMFDYITPGFRGVHTLDLFTQGLKRKVSVEVNMLNIQSKPKTDFESIVNFIYEGLSLNRPVAFLNLHNGFQDSLESWHWVLIVGIYYKDEFPMIEFVDNGEMKKMDLSAWYMMNRKRAGMLYLSN